MAANNSRVGYWYASGPADKQYTPGDPSFNLHTVVSDTSEIPGHVTVRNGGGHTFAVPAVLGDQIASPA